MGKTIFKYPAFDYVIEGVFEDKVNEQGLSRPEGAGGRKKPGGGAEV